MLCLSTRLAPQAVANLVHSTHTQAILVSSQVDTLVHESTCLFSKEHGQSKSPSVHLVPPFAEFLDPSSDLDCQHVPPPPRFEDVARDAVILHSSGSTGQCLFLFCFSVVSFRHHKTSQVCQSRYSTRRRISLATHLATNCLRETSKVPSTSPPCPCIMCVL